MNATDFFDFSDQATTESKGKYLFQPHAAHVISIFRMMSCGDTHEYIRNNLVEIGTGEGKLLILAMTSVVLALLGYSVNCECYSSYLSERDYEEFYYQRIENDKYLDEKRNKYFNDDNLKNEQLIKHLLELNKGVEVEVPVVSRTVCLMDATGSMGNLLECCTKTITKDFQRAKEALSDADIVLSSKELFIEIMVVERTKFQRPQIGLKSPMIYKFLWTKTKPGNEAIEIGLWHCNQVRQKM